MAYVKTEVRINWNTNEQGRKLANVLRGVLNIRSDAELCNRMLVAFAEEVLGVEETRAILGADEFTRMAG